MNPYIPSICKFCENKIIDVDAGCPCSESFDKKYMFCNNCGKKIVRRQCNQLYCGKCKKIKNIEKALKLKKKKPDKTVLICEFCGHKYPINYNIIQNRLKFFQEKCPKCEKNRFQHEPAKLRNKSCRHCDSQIDRKGLCRKHYEQQRILNNKTSKILAKK